MILEKLKADIKAAMKWHDTLKRDILKYVVATVESAPPSCLNDSFAAKTILKTIEANKALLAIRPDEKLVSENEILTNYLPKAIDLESLREGITNAISGAKSEGQAVGMSMKWLKAEGHDVSTSGEAVKFFVQGIWNDK
jgi:uncharacterized protein YqeY